MASFIKTPEQQELLTKINQLKQVFTEREPQLDALGSFPFQDFEDLKKINYHTLTLPKEYGGQGMGLYEYILCQEAIAEGSGSTGLCIGWHNGIILEYAENRHWNEETASWLLTAVKNGAIINTAASERNAGSPTRGALPKTSVKRNGNQLLINGEKTFTSLAPILDYFLVTATNEQSEVELVIIPRDITGLSIKETWDSVAMRGTASHTLLLENVTVPEHFVLSNTAYQKSLYKGWLLHIPACYIGIAAAARNYAIGFAASYVPASFGKPIAEAPNIKQIIGDIELELATARHLLYGTIERYEQSNQKESLEEALEVTKLAVTNAAISIVDKAMKIVGARALSASNQMHRYYLNVRAGLYNPPMEDVVKGKLANKAIQSFQQK
ncbi:acyl-CoA/acyl-ACP dehydrogenase [Caldibacillus lycopersici]|uniref:Acyl-CoA/acyl-ACP dehydrogenase n=1 Tax=Perspicuibacillus lycopersici TaxID=1325689 RepID=A0AAE3LRT9_9BACI|nr:acyl-CoA dehydrogenase family protein [Perspicuibacillus lycopersici]MCU9615039.1 acyl-CoA/acyl-ACP dehydrogenase [Perspicuibacillus lycopersici]